MKHYRFAFYISEKVRTHQFGEMLKSGAAVHGDVVDLIPQEGFTEPLLEYDGIGNLGLARAAKRLTDAYKKAGKHFLFFDKGYFQRKTYWRVSVDAWQPLAYFQRYMHPDDRMLIIGPKTLHKRKKWDADKSIVFAGACQNYTNFCELGNVNDYNAMVLKAIRANTKRHIVYRPNPSWYTKHQDEFRPIHKQIPDVELSTPETPFSDELERCHLLVTHGTSAAVAALSSAVPNMVIGGGICKPLAMGFDQLDQIEEASVPKDEIRRQFFADLAYCQWSSKELINGRAWAEIRSVLSYLTPTNREPISQADIIRQYKLMHQHPGYFRGLTMTRYASQIKELIDKTNTETLLDYGSGKGEPHTNRQLSWDVGVTCYDPAVPDYDTLPSGKFDGVICCDVMEHIPEEAVPATLRQILGYAKKFAFFSIGTKPATKSLPDGRNCHITVKPEAWWQSQVRAAAVDLGKSDLPISITTQSGDK